MTKKFKIATKPLEHGQLYYYFTTNNDNLYSKDFWGNKYLDFQRLRLYRIFLTEKDAKRAGEFVKEFIRLNPEKLNYITTIPVQGTEVWFGVDIWGTEHDSNSINFDINNEFHKMLLDNFRLYETANAVTEASNLVNLALETEYKRQKYKYLTKVKPDTKVWCVHFSTLSSLNTHSQSKLCYFYYSPDSPSHQVLLDRGVLFAKKKHALRAANAMLRKINPSVCELTLKPTK